MFQTERHCFVYFVASKSRTLYCGVTSNLPARIMQHREGAIPGFTADYNCNRLVWCEPYEDIRNAIDREKQIKKWRREKKLTLIQKDNPTWADLSQGWFEDTAGPSTPLRFGRMTSPKFGQLHAPMAVSAMLRVVCNSAPALKFARCS